MKPQRMYLNLDNAFSCENKRTYKPCFTFRGANITSAERRIKKKKRCDGSQLVEMPVNAVVNFSVMKS